MIEKFEAKTKTIDGQTIEVTPFVATTGLPLKIRWVKLIGPPLARMIAHIDDSQKELDINLNDVSSALMTLCEQLDPQASLALIVDTLRGTRVDGLDAGGKGEFDSLFASDYLFMYKVVLFVLEVNYGSFFAMAGIGKKLTAVMKKSKPT